MTRIMLALAVVAVSAFAVSGQEKPQVEPAKVTAPDEPEGMVRIFNGKDLTGWEGDTRLWSVKDGAIRGETTQENPTHGNTFLVWKGGTLGDFELRLSFRIERGNSGIQYRSRQVESKDPKNQWIVGGYQAEVENTPGKVGFLYHERARGWLCSVGDKVEIGEDGKPQVVGKVGDKAAIAATYKKSDWNDYIIIGKGNRLVHYLNGVQTVDVTDNDVEPSIGKDGKPEPLKCRALSGILALQIHAGPPMWVEFKDIRVKHYDGAK